MESLWFCPPLCKVLRKIENIKISLREDVRNENLNSDTIFFKKLIHAYYKDHPRKKPLTLKDIDQISLDKVTNFYKDRFSDASDFVFTSLSIINLLSQGCTLTFKIL